MRKVPEIGDAVILKGGNQPMVITEILENEIGCSSFVQGRPRNYRFHKDALAEIDKPPAPQFEPGIGDLVRLRGHESPMLAILALPPDHPSYVTCGFLDEAGTLHQFDILVAALALDKSSEEYDRLRAAQAIARAEKAARQATAFAGLAPGSRVGVD